MREQHSTTIGKYKYETTQLGAKVGRQVFVRLTKILGQGLAGGTGSAALGNVLMAMTPEDVDYLCDLFAAETRIYTSPTTAPLLSDIFDLHFAGDYGSMVKWLGWCVEVNFASFLEGFGVNLSTLKEKAKESLSNSPKDAIG